MLPEAPDAVRHEVDTLVEACEAFAATFERLADDVDRLHLYSATPAGTAEK